MKQRMISVLIIFLLACKKEHITKPGSVLGTWRWIYTYEDLPLSATNPLTPQNSGIEELIIFKTDHTWEKITNNTITDSGTFSIGRGSYTPYTGSAIYQYDSIGFYKNSQFVGWDAYEIYRDTLKFIPGISGRFSSYTLPFNGSKWWVSQ